jgi:hypothetical protein
VRTKRVPAGDLSGGFTTVLLLIRSRSSPRVWSEHLVHASNGRCFRAGHWCPTRWREEPSIPSGVHRVGCVFAYHHSSGVSCSSSTRKFIAPTREGGGWTGGCLVNNSVAPELLEQVYSLFPPGCPDGQPRNTTRLARMVFANMRCFWVDFRAGGQCPGSKRILEMPTVVNDSSISILPRAGNGVSTTEERVS